MNGDSFSYTALMRSDTSQGGGEGCKRLERDGGRRETEGVLKL